MHFSFHAQENSSTRTALRRFFPVPDFLALSPVGLDISDEAIRVLRFRSGPAGLELDFFSKKDLPSGVMADGDIIKKEPIVEALSSLKKQFGFTFVSATLPDEKSYLFKTTLPLESLKNVHETVEFRLEENVPIAPQDALFEAALLPRKKGQENTVDAGVVVVPKEIVAKYTEVCSAAGLVPVSFEIASAAIAHAVLPHGMIEAILLIHIGDVKSTIFVVSGGEVRFTSTVAVGAKTLTNAVLREFSVSAAAAEALKREGGFIRNKKNENLLSALVSSVSVLRDETLKVLNYWDNYINTNNEGADRIKKILLSGRDASLSGFAEHFASFTKLPTEIVDVWTNCFSFDSYIPPLIREDSLEYPAAIGLALPQKI